MKNILMRLAAFGLAFIIGITPVYWPVVEEQAYFHTLLPIQHYLQPEGQPVNGLKCTIKCQNQRLKPGDPLLVDVILENQTSKRIEFEADPSFHIEPWQKTDPNYSYYTVIDFNNPHSPLTRFGPDWPKVTVPANSKISLSYDLAALGWAYILCNLRTNENLYARRLKGNHRLYRLSLSFRYTASVRSNDIAIWLDEPGK